MSKMDGLRAMREARYAQAQKQGATAGTRSTVARKATAPKPTSAVADNEPEAAEALCGHRNMSGRSCTREQGHAAKSHRYS